MLTPEHLARAMDRVVGAARAMMSDPNNMAVRTGYVRATFNHDITAQVIAALADAREHSSPRQVGGESSRDDQNPSSQGGKAK